MCNQSEISVKVAELIEWQELLEQATEMVDTLKDFIKAEMNERGVEEMEAGTHICRFTTVLSNRFDTTAFKASGYAELYKAFTKQVTSKRFTVS